jgi:hypothetical protein
MTTRETTWWGAWRGTRNCRVEAWDVIGSTRKTVTARRQGAWRERYCRRKKTTVAGWCFFRTADEAVAFLRDRKLRKAGHAARAAAAAARDLAAFVEEYSPGTVARMQAEDREHREASKEVSGLIDKGKKGATEAVKMDTTKLKLLKNRVLVQESEGAKVGSIILPVDQSAGMRAKVLNVAQGPTSPLCEEIYPGDTALIREGAPHDHLQDRLFVFNAVSIWGVIRDGVPHAINGRVLVKVDPELADVDEATGIWTPTEARAFPDAGTAVIDGREARVRFNIRAPQRRFGIAGQVYAIMDEDGIVGVEGC